ncbi:MAG: hypothetical protein JO147_10350 [Actinobacteria bacterium]|nr:hypothetical protein [Actinomycetota bacterium]
MGRTTGHRGRLIRLGALVAVLVPVPTLLAPGVAAFVPHDFAPPSWIVSVGDSYISGEGGRWAGNASSPAHVDALGPNAYADSNSAYPVAGCDRSTSAEVFIGTARGQNLACSGAGTATVPYSPRSPFKPGLDFYDDHAGHIGQALALEQFAAGHHVSAVVVSIGGNDFDFASIVEDCVSDYLLSPSFWKNHCDDDGAVRAAVSSTTVRTVSDRITTGLRNLAQALAADGYDPADYTLIVQTYPSPLAPGAAIRYPESGLARQTVGGCGFWNADADYADNTIVPTINSAVRAAVSASGLPDVQVLDVADLFDGHRLCENTDHKLQETDLSSWRSPGAADLSEWVVNIRTVSALAGPYTIQESLHPNYWGQLALRNCLRQAYDSADRGGRCVPAGPGMNAHGEPRALLR